MENEQPEPISRDVTRESNLQLVNYIQPTTIISKETKLKLYISFSNANRRTNDVFNIAELLAATGEFEVFIDKHNSAESLSMAGATAIAETDFFVAFHDKSYARSRLALQEYFQAELTQKFIIPVRLQHVDLSPAESWLRVKLQDRFVIDYDDTTAPPDNIVSAIKSRIDVLLGRNESRISSYNEPVNRDEFEALVSLVARQQKTMEDLKEQMKSMTREFQQQMTILTGATKKRTRRTQKVKPEGQEPTAENQSGQPELKEGQEATSEKPVDDETGEKN